jgi:glycosyltransferase involved in cell wall biosynthesis
VGEVVSVKVTVVSDFRDGYEVALEACYVRGFDALGAQVDRVSLHSRLPRRSGTWGVVRAGLWAAANQPGIVKDVLAKSADVVVLVKAAAVFAGSVRTWRAAGMRVVNVFPDNPFDAMGASGLGMWLLDQLRACDRVFVHDRFAVGQLRQLGVRSAFHAFARDPLLHDPSLRGERLFDPPRIAFIGNPDPEWIRFLRSVSDLGLGLWGQWGWARLAAGDPLAGCVRGTERMGPDMVRCLGSTLLSVNLLRPSQKTAHNMRTFESPACGVCTLSEASNGVLELMEDGVEVATFRTPEELRRTAMALLDDVAKREAIARAGWARVEHETYQARARHVLESVA